MSERRAVYGYLSGPEELRRTELVWGVLREPPAPRYGHQSVVTRATVLLDQCVRAAALGRVCVSPIDVVLDEERALVVQPDVLFVSNARAAIIRDQVWGAPDLVVEVLSRATRHRDCTSKLQWYRKYGVREYWLIDPHARTVEVVEFPARGRLRRQSFSGGARVRSVVLATFDASASAFFE